MQSQNRDLQFTLPPQRSLLVEIFNFLLHYIYTSLLCQGAIRLFQYSYENTFANFHSHIVISHAHNV